MTPVQTAARDADPVLPRAQGRVTGRWMLSFAGYPLGGYAAYLLTGRVDSLGPAPAGGLLTGAGLGATLAWYRDPANAPA